METEDKVSDMLSEYERVCRENRDRERMYAAAVLNEIDVEYGVVSARVERDRQRLQDLTALRNVTARKLPEAVQEDADDGESGQNRRVVSPPVGAATARPGPGDMPKLPRKRVLLRDRILAFLSGGPATARQIWAAVGGSSANVYMQLAHLRDPSGLVESFAKSTDPAGRGAKQWRLRLRAEQPPQAAE